MADLVRQCGGTLAEWTASNPIIPARLLVVEEDTNRFKIGARSGLVRYLDLPYAPKGDRGEKGDPGDTTSIVDLIGASSSSLTLETGVHTLVASINKQWATGMWVSLSSTADPTNFMVGVIRSYNNNTGALEVLVANSGMVSGVGTYFSWSIFSTYVSAANHANTHITEGLDFIGYATADTPGLLSPADFSKLFNLDITGAFIGDTEPANMPSGSVWFCTADIINTVPVIAAIYPQYALLNTAFTVNVFLSDDYDVNLVSLAITASSNTAIVPINSMTIRGSGATRFIDVSARDTAGSSTITITATDHVGATASTTFPVTVVAEAKTFTASSGGHGTINPNGTILVPQTGNITFTQTPDSGYALSSFTVDGTPVTDVDEYIFNNVSADHTIVANFDLGYTIVATAIGNGTITPDGNVGAVANSSKTFNFAGNAGYEPYQKFIDGGAAQDASSGAHTFTGVTTNHTISVNFQAIMYDLTWSGLTNGTIEGQASGSTTAAYNASKGFLVTPNADYEMTAIIVGGTTVDSTVRTSGYTYTIPAVTSDLVLSATFRIQAPVAATNLSAGITDSTHIGLSWTAGARATTYTVYHSTTSGTAAWLIANGTAITGVSGTTYSHVVADSSVTYYYTVVSVNSTASASGSNVSDNSNAAPSVTSFSAALPTVTSASAVKMVTDGSSSGSLIWEYTLPSDTTGTFECDFYDSGESNYMVQFAVYGEVGRSTYASIDMTTSSSTTQYRISTNTTGSIYYGSRSTGWHHVTVNATGNNSAQVFIDGILCYQGSIAASGIGTAGGRVIRLRVNTLLSSASAKTGYFANVKYNTTDVSVATQGTWTSITALGTTTWGV